VHSRTEPPGLIEEKGIHKEEGKSNVDKKGGCTMLNPILLVLSNQEVVAATQ
jgi:hypothetical protein